MRLCCVRVADDKHAGCLHEHKAMGTSSKECVLKFSELIARKEADL